ncbi:class I SAM-dependent methyltransferase [Roseivivax sp. CAU 1761]
MSAVPPAALDRLYAATDDPWVFRTSAYEQEKFRATRAALDDRRWLRALELGCGNGELARHLAPLCDAYTGLDAVPRALDAACAAVPGARFVQGWLPDDLPAGRFDLVILSEILYFLDAPGIARLGRALDAASPCARLAVVTWLGDTGNPLQGGEALDALRRATRGPWRCHRQAEGYRIDLRAEPGAAP